MPDWHWIACYKYIPEKWQDTYHKPGIRCRSVRRQIINDGKVPASVGRTLYNRPEPRAPASSTTRIYPPLVMSAPVYMHVERHSTPAGGPPTLLNVQNHPYTSLVTNTKVIRGRLVLNRRVFRRSPTTDRMIEPGSRTRSPTGKPCMRSKTWVRAGSGGGGWGPMFKWNTWKQRASAHGGQHSVHGSLESLDGTQVREKYF